MIRDRDFLIWDGVNLILPRPQLWYTICGGVCYEE